jgi:hypothetical protein
MSFLWPRARAGLLSDDGQNDRLTEHLAGSVPWLGAQRREPARRWQKKLTESHLGGSLETHTLTAPAPLHPAQGATPVPYLPLGLPLVNFSLRGRAQEAYSLLPRPTSQLFFPPPSPPGRLGLPGLGVPPLVNFSFPTQGPCRGGVGLEGLGVPPLGNFSFHARPPLQGPQD